MDEFFEVATLVQTGKVQNFPLVLMGCEFWEPLMKFMRDRLIAQATIDREDYDRILVTDSPEKAMEHIANAAIKEFGFEWKPRVKPQWCLGERSIWFRKVDMNFLRELLGLKSNQT
jgi:predicted Rossmann-fold nucleotide-binding protein